MPRPGRIFQDSGRRAGAGQTVVRGSCPGITVDLMLEGRGRAGPPAAAGHLHVNAVASLQALSRFTADRMLEPSGVRYM
eukprot:SAG22_NODE_7560_length_728_cov_2.286169_2_plen_79_part_00